MNSSLQNKRKERDIMKLMISNYEVTLTDQTNQNDFYVVFMGPKDSPYEGGIWKVHVLLPDGYPYKSPSIGFHNRIFHPNVDEVSGTVCLDVINQTWSPMYDLINIFDTFLPQLLLYPNPTDPLNGEAARLLLKDGDKYKEKVKDYVKKYASETIALKTENTKGLSTNGNAEQKEEIKSQASSELSNASIEPDEEDI